MDQETRAPPGRTGKRAPPYANGGQETSRVGGGGVPSVR